MRVLVTGGTGFLGRRLAITLKSLGYHVTAVGRNEKIGQTLELQGITFKKCDLTQKEQAIQVCANQDYVFHCAALSSSWGKYESFYQVNILGTQNVIEGCMVNKVKSLIHVSTPSIYARNKDQFDVPESASLPRKKVNAYAETKYQAEMILDVAYEGGLPVIMIRPRAIFGPGDPSILPRLLDANKKGVLPLIGRGNALIDVTYVDNVVHALIQCMNSPESTLGEKYNITNGEPLPFIELANQLFTKLDEQQNSKKIPYPVAYMIASFLELTAKITRSEQEPLLTKATVGMLGRSLTLDISKAKKELDYKPKISIAEGIDAYVESLKSL